MITNYVSNLAVAGVLVAAGISSATAGDSPRQPKVGTARVIRRAQVPDDALPPLADPAPPTPINPRPTGPVLRQPVAPQSVPATPPPPAYAGPETMPPGFVPLAPRFRPAFGYGIDDVPPRILEFGWPAIGVYRRDLPYPTEKEKTGKKYDEHPRKSRIEVRTEWPARVFVDDEELECEKGVYQFEPEKPLVPGIAYTRDVRVEAYNEVGEPVARTVTVYLRMGRVTELTFE